MSKDYHDKVKAWEATVRKTRTAAKRRAKSIFGSISIAHADDEDNKEWSTHDDISRGDKILPNGDFYTGQWYDNLPHGDGKYLWTDGCMYVGEWYKGKTMGKGRFSWPSGATYEGEFKSGYMDGKGTYTGSSGETYKGQWVMNLKHGVGLQNYANGDWYEGEWRRGLQEGQGRYQWKDGSNYDGEWENGVMCGKGTFVWEKEDIYDGNWCDGMPQGNGTFRCADGSYYTGYWSVGCNDQNGSYSPSEDGDPEWDPQSVYKSLCKYNICQGEKVLLWPSQKKVAVWKSSKTEDRRMSVDGRVNIGLDRTAGRLHMYDIDEDVHGNAIVERELGGDLLALNLEDGSFRRNSALPVRVPKTTKRQGETISKGHKNYELMLNLQLGIRHAVGRPAPTVSLNLKPSAFDPKEKVWTRFPPEGTKHTPPHNSSEFKWKDYCPLVFRSLRKLFKVDPADYMLSICGNEALRELSSPGKSGSFFYLTNDDRYMIKTMKKAEVKVLLRMLSAYYNHVKSYENTMLIKFFGLHCVKLTGPIQKKVRFIIMGNLFCSEYSIHRRFDLKGSTFGRTTEKPESEIDSTTILKDLDLNFIFRLPKSWFQEFCKQVDKDCELLEQEGIMDYSLLVGLHFKETSANGVVIPSGTKTPPAEPDHDEAPRLSRVDMNQLILDPSKWPSIKLGINMPARAERTLRVSADELVGEPTGEFYEVMMFFGIIDILQDYDISKKLEHAYKSIQYDPTSISAVDPKQYSKRFRDFIYRIFVEDA